MALLALVKSYNVDLFPNVSFCQKFGFKNVFDAMK